MPSHEEAYKDVPKLVDRFKDSVKSMVEKGATADELTKFFVDGLLANGLGYLDSSDMKTIIAKACRDAATKK
jgi:hypothetical protein